MEFFNQSQTLQSLNRKLNTVNNIDPLTSKSILFTLILLDLLRH